jgi:hypothetical protein
MREEELWEWRILWEGQWTTTMDGATEAEIRKRHPEAERIDGSRFMRQISDTGPRHRHGVLTGPSSGVESRDCGVCEHFGGWVPVQIGMTVMQISYRTHGKCLRAGLSKGITQPDHGCAFWTQKRVPIECASPIA